MKIVDRVDTFQRLEADNSKLKKWINELQTTLTELQHQSETHDVL